METQKKQNEDKNEDKNKDICISEHDFIGAIVELLRLACSEAISEIIKAIEEEE